MTNKSNTSAALSGMALPPLDGDTGADVCVIGASFIGLRTAYDLLRKEKTVVVIDAGSTLPSHPEREEDARHARLNDLLTGAGMEEQPALDHRQPATSAELARAVLALGGRLHGDCPALEILAQHNMQVVKTPHGTIVARVVVVVADKGAGSGTRGSGGKCGSSGAGGQMQPALRVLTTPAPDIVGLFAALGDKAA